MAITTENVSIKKDSEANKKGRAAQSKAGKTRLNAKKEFVITKDGKHLNKGDKVLLNKPTEHLFREIGMIK